ncbi:MULTISPECIES: hypothetical protein [unclassified Okeania]|nr:MULTISPECIES: hypothetical protein [unclassified Okeania]
MNFRISESSANNIFHY